MKKKKVVINLITPLMLFLMALAGCSGVKSEMDKSANLGNFKSYSWKAPDVKTDNPVYNKSDLTDNSIKQNIESELANKGMRRDDQNPDLYILYHSYFQTLQQTSGAVYGYPPITGYSSTYGTMGYGGLGSGYGYGDYNSFTYPTSYVNAQETLIIDFIDARTNKVIWRGSTNSEVSDVSHIDKRHAKEVHAIIKKYSENSEEKMVKHHI